MKRRSGRTAASSSSFVPSVIGHSTVHPALSRSPIHLNNIRFSKQASGAIKTDSKFSSTKTIDLSLVQVSTDGTKLMCFPDSVLVEIFTNCTFRRDAQNASYVARSLIVCALAQVLGEPEFRRSTNRLRKRDHCVPVIFCSSSCCNSNKASI